MKLTIKDTRTAKVSSMFFPLWKGKGTQAVHDGRWPTWLPSVVALLARKRWGVAGTKTVATKGTGRAGLSFQSPLAGGGVVLGRGGIFQKVSKSTNNLPAKAPTERERGQSFVNDLNFRSKMGLHRHPFRAAGGRDGAGRRVRARGLALAPRAPFAKVELPTSDSLTHIKSSAPQLVFTRGAFEKVQERLKRG
jgi:hypothetical protein